MIESGVSRVVMGLHWRVVLVKPGPADVMLPKAGPPVGSPAGSPAVPPAVLSAVPPARSAPPPVDDGELAGLHHLLAGFVARLSQGALAILPAWRRWLDASEGEGYGHTSTGADLVPRGIVAEQVLTFPLLWQGMPVPLHIEVRRQLPGGRRNGDKGAAGDDAGADAGDDAGVTLRLSPPHLGEMRIDLTLHAGQVGVAFAVQGESALQVLAGGRSELEKGFERSGLALRNLVFARLGSSPGEPSPAGAITGIDLTG